jgi:hypothetical protein
MCAQDKRWRGLRLAAVVGVALYSRRGFVLAGILEETWPGTLVQARSKALVPGDQLLPPSTAELVNLSSWKERRDYS